MKKQKTLTQDMIRCQSDVKFFLNSHMNNWSPENVPQRSLQKPKELAWKSVNEEKRVESAEFSRFYMIKKVTHFFVKSLNF